MSDPIRAALRKAFILAGHISLSARPLECTTVLGSCVSICMYDLKLGIGGMNHFLFPGQPITRESNPNRWGGPAIENLVHGLLRVGARRDHLQAKLFGGSHYIMEPSQAHLHAGKRNSEFALQELMRLKIPIASGDFGGKSGRKLVFHSHTGECWVRSFQHDE